MTSFTTRYPSPAASRSGKYAAALPNDPGLDEILADPALSSTAKALVTVMVKNWAWFKDHCWPCDKTLAAKVGKSVGHVQRCLHELDLAGRIGREKTDEVPNGRRIWLLWRRPGNQLGAQREMTTARGASTAPARDEQIVVVKGGNELGEARPPSQRPRPEPPVPAPVSTVAPAPDRLLGSNLREIAPEACRESPTTVEAPPPVLSHSAPPRAIEAASRVSGEGPRPPSVKEPSEMEGIPRLSSIGAPTPSASPHASPPAPTAPDPKVLIGLTPQEQVRLQELPAAAREQILQWIALGDAILLKEARNRLAPPRTPEPPPAALPTPALLASLPGRHDRIAQVAGRLAADLGDQKSYRYYQALARAVSSREQPAEALISAWQQGKSPKARRPGAVFATAWKRETRSMG
jgi:hypothetical protein